MRNRLRLVNLTLVGYRKDYKVKFKEGLNYITGPTSTGKTAILEMINYALGAEKHKDYIEIRESCSKVELEIQVGDEKYKIQRKLFEFTASVLIFKWNTEEDEYIFLDTKTIDGPSNVKSLSRFLLELIQLPDITVVNQPFSFRDLFKYSYLKQTQIDNENIMGEKNWSTAIKRKPTFEIIFNIYDQLLANLKASLKKLTEELKELEIKKTSINEFVKNAEIPSLIETYDRKTQIENEIKEKQEILNDIKGNDERSNENKEIRRLQNNIVILKKKVINEENSIVNQKGYIQKLTLLVNQYRKEKEEIEFLNESMKYLNKIENVFCPECLQIVEESQTDIYNCALCHQPKEKEQIEYVIENKTFLISLSKKTNELIKFIQEQGILLENLEKARDQMSIELKFLENHITHLYEGYVNPFIEQIEQLNYEIGCGDRILLELDSNVKMLKELNRIDALVSQKTEMVESLKGKIKDSEEKTIDKDKIIEDLSINLYTILEDFKFPKLEEAYISEKNYLPYVRDRLYSELGSLAAVTLITMAYYLDIAINAIGNEFNHLGILIIDSPRKNLGAQSADVDFKDEAIFNSIIKTFIKIVAENEQELQLIVVNNGSPDFLSEDNIIVRFDGDGTKGLPYGLIDDI